ncbi:hypothetical protein L2E82_13065 [Cichorium intybus]|uniref:Uncharacterized protein n=1 Tax=Cichorium intybus TaxID=13427 RepID=A0ACB9GIW9_CICIN|nr:hypothetical protein L2E82_13065 [Cichorium intybus]
MAARSNTFSPKSAIYSQNSMDWFADIVADLYTIEFQKRGLPHCHTLLWVSSSSRIRNPVDVDRYISVELPNPTTDPLLYRTITTCKIHGPCGLINPNSVCMKGGKCSKSFPKPLNTHTFFDKQGYVHYKRNSSASHTLNNGIQVHNGFVVPSNRRLCSKFNAHINVEYCGWNMLIKYLFKYISKGVERVSFGIHNSQSDSAASSTGNNIPIDEIKNFVDGRFICPHESAWRLFNFNIHVRFPPVQVLAVHLEDMQNTTFQDNDNLESVVKNPAFGKTTLNSWLRSNRDDDSGSHLKYSEYSKLFRWDLLHASGIIGDDKEWQSVFDDAALWASCSQLRKLFCHLLLFCDVSNPLQMWEYTWSKMSDDVRYRFRSVSSSNDDYVSDDILQQQILLELEKDLNGCVLAKSLSDFQIPLPASNICALLENRLLLEESGYDKEELHR